MIGNNVMWQPEEVEDLLLYYKEKIQELGKTLILREAHHEECAQRINKKYRETSLLQVSQAEGRMEGYFESKVWSWC